MLITGTAFFEMLRPRLLQLGVKSVLLCTYRVPDERTLRMADYGYHLVKSDGPERLVEIAMQQQVSAFLSTSMPEDMNLRDARASGILSHHGIRCITQPEQFIVLCADKHQCKQLLGHAGFTVALGFRAAGLDEARQAAQKLGYPVVCKPAGRWAGQGVFGAANDAQLAAYFESVEYEDITVEQYLDGDEFSVETVVYPEWSIALAPIYKGRTFPGSHSMEHVRISPYPCAGLQRLALAMARAINSEGPAEFEFIVTAGGPVLIEVNPRFSGVTRMGVVGSGFHTPMALVDMALGRWDEPSYRGPARLIVELPVMAGDSLPEDWCERLRGCTAVSRVIVLAVGATVGRVEFTGAHSDILTGAVQAHAVTNQSIGQLERLSPLLSSAETYLSRGSLFLAQGGNASFHKEVRS